MSANNEYAELNITHHKISHHNILHGLAQFEMLNSAHLVQCNSCDVRSSESSNVTHWSSNPAANIDNFIPLFDS